MTCTGFLPVRGPAPYRCRDVVYRSQPHNVQIYGPSDGSEHAAVRHEGVSTDSKY